MFFVIIITMATVGIKMFLPSGPESHVYKNVLQALARLDRWSEVMRGQQGGELSSTKLSLRGALQCPH